jgi:hypothetical protein
VWPRLRVLARCSPTDKFLLVRGLRQLRDMAASQALKEGSGAATKPTSSGGGMPLLAPWFSHHRAHTGYKGSAATSTDKSLSDNGWEVGSDGAQTAFLDSASSDEWEAHRSGALQPADAVGEVANSVSAVALQEVVAMTGTIRHLNGCVEEMFPLDVQS